MKTNHSNKRSQGFTLIEMVGVLAVIAILAALLVPKIFGAMAESRCSNTVSSINSLKTAVMDYYGKKNAFPVNISDLNLADAFAPKVGTPTDAFVADATSIKVVLTKVDGADATRIEEILGTRLVTIAANADGITKDVTVVLADRAAQNPAAVVP